MTEEKWKNIKGTYCEVSTLGNVRDQLNKKPFPTYLRSGYKSISMGSWMKIHRLVALAFIPNNDPTKVEVNHIDGNKLNNNVTNLEWVTKKENNQHAVKNGLAKVTEREVTQCDLAGNIIKTYKSVLEATKAVGASDGSITKVCKGKQLTCLGFKWKYTNPNPNMVKNLDDIDFTKFKEIKQYGTHKIREGYYINNKGDIYSKRTNMFLKHGTQPDNLEYVYLSDGKNDYQCLVHRLVAIHFIDGCTQTSTRIVHTDKDATNNNVNNLHVCDLKQKPIQINKNDDTLELQNVKQIQKDISVIAQKNKTITERYEKLTRYFKIN